MSTAPILIDQLRQQGFRITRLRRALLQVLTEASQPLSVQAMDERLTQQGVQVNKTTIYREIDFLEDQKLVHAVQFQEDLKRYELSHDHHHHLVCVKCGKIEDIKIKDFEDFFPALKQKLKTGQKFHLAHHSLELFGFCETCVE